MLKQTRSSTVFDEVRTPTTSVQMLKMESSVSTQILMLIDINYCHWAVRMEVSLEGQDFCDVIKGREEIFILCL